MNFEKLISDMKPGDEHRLSLAHSFEFRGAPFPPGDYRLYLIEYDDKVMAKLDRIR